VASGASDSEGQHASPEKQRKKRKEEKKNKKKTKKQKKKKREKVNTTAQTKSWPNGNTRATVRVNSRRKSKDRQKRKENTMRKQTKVKKRKHSHLPVRLGFTKHFQADVHPLNSVLKSVRKMN
jgi:hypothetical protein